MKKLKNDFFEAWESEISAYQEVYLTLREQKKVLMEWDIKKFESVTREVALKIGFSHKETQTRFDLMESIFVVNEITEEENSLKTIEKLFKNEYHEKFKIFFKVFSNTLKNIDRLSAENKQLIKTGLQLVGDNLETIADIIDSDRVYSRVGMINRKNNSILLNRQV